MKVRACILVVCMTVVPALAMFSHHVPTGLCEMARARLWQPVAAWLQPAGAAHGEETDSHAAPATVAVPAATTAAAGERAADRLTALGVVAIDVRPLEGVTGMHVASCRVAMDADGQLHRVFQAPGADPGAATAALADQVQAWRDRLAVRATLTERAAEPR